MRLKRFCALLALLPLVHPVGHCYSCSGTCHHEHCNCQIGSCPSDQCFIEKKPTEERGVFRITKGCLRRSPRKVHGCEYDHFSDHILCVCKGPFCNDQIFVRPYHRRNVTCRKCGDRDPECGNTCAGQWCHEDVTTGASGCGFGPPSLPFFYKGSQLLNQGLRNKLCVTISRGMSKPRRHCICATPLCNAYTPRVQLMAQSILRSRSLSSNNEGAIEDLPYQVCINCEISSQDSAITSSCKQHRCIGHFCTYAAQRHFTTAVSRGTSFHSMSEKHGCINVSDASHNIVVSFKGDLLGTRKARIWTDEALYPNENPLTYSTPAKIAIAMNNYERRIQLGCSRKWMHNEYEEIMCACIGKECNRDEFTASTYVHSVVSSLIVIIVMWVLYV